MVKAYTPDGLKKVPVPDNVRGARQSPWRPWPNGIGIGWPASIRTVGATTWLIQDPGGLGGQGNRRARGNRGNPLETSPFIRIASPVFALAKTAAP